MSSVVLQMGDPVDEGDGSFEIEVDLERGRTTVRLTGDLDVASSPALWRHLDDLTPTRRVTLDLTDVGFVDSSGLGCLFKLYRCVADADGMLVATGASPALRHVMEAAGLHRVIAIVS